MNSIRCFNKIISLFLFFSFTNLKSENTKKFDEELYNWSTVIAEVFNHAKSKLYYSLSLDEAIVRMLDTFIRQDPHSRVLGPKEYKELICTTSGEFYGIGIIVSPNKTGESSITILGTKKDSPAQKAGIQKYDKIISINNKKISTLSFEQALAELKGQIRFSPVKIEILRNNKNLDLTIKRDTIKEDNLACFYFKQYNIAYCAISLFTQSLANQLERQLQKIVLKKPEGIIIDLRDNVGGTVRSAVDCSSFFLPPNSLIVQIKDKCKKVLEKYYSTLGQIISSEIPIIILINQHTSSSAEIFAATLHDYAQSNNPKTNKHIFLVGTKTQGKGTVQEVFPLSNNCGLKITTSQFYPQPLDKPIDRIGIDPDFNCEPKLNLNHEIKIKNDLKDADNNYSILNLNKDFQLQQAINLMSLVNLAKKMDLKFKSHKQWCDWLESKHVCENQNQIEQID